MNISGLIALFGCFRKGQAIVQAARVKNITVLANALAVFFSTLIEAAGVYHVHLPAISQTDINNFSINAGFIIIGIMGFYNAVVHVITSDKIGFPAAPADTTPPSDDMGSDRAKSLPGLSDSITTEKPSIIPGH